MSQSQPPSFLLRWIVVFVGVFFLAELLPGVEVSSIWDGLVAALLLSVLNSTVRPFLQLIALPITFLSLGIFYFIINAAMVMWASSWVDGFDVNGWGTAILFSLLLSLFNTLILGKKRKAE